MRGRVLVIWHCKGLEHLKKKETERTQISIVIVTKKYKRAHTQASLKR